MKCIDYSIYSSRSSTQLTHCLVIEIHSLVNMSNRQFPGNFFSISHSPLYLYCDPLTKRRPWSSRFFVLIYNYQIQISCYNIAVTWVGSFFLRVNNFYNLLACIFGVVPSETLTTKATLAFIFFFCLYDFNLNLWKQIG